MVKAPKVGDILRGKISGHYYIVLDAEKTKKQYRYKAACFQENGIVTYWFKPGGHRITIVCRGD
jgi:hypothetical protein